jgi:asparagine synthetase B (glutamine-hydrolysing)
MISRVLHWIHPCSGDSEAGAQKPSREPALVVPESNVALAIAAGSTDASVEGVPAGSRCMRLSASTHDAVRAHRERCRSAFLSGGVDSSTVVALMSEVSDEPVRTFTVGFESQAYDERPLARLVAQQFRTDHHEFVLQPESVDVLPKLAAHFHEPFADSSALPTYYVSKFARESVKVALSGDGGDELFVGYTGFAGVELARRAQSYRHSSAGICVDQCGAGRRSSALIGMTASRWQKRLADTARRLRSVSGRRARSSGSTSSARS